jgi:hypothetical protein
MRISLAVLIVALLRASLSSFTPIPIPGPQPTAATYSMGFPRSTTSYTNILGIISASQSPAIRPVYKSWSYIPNLGQYFSRTDASVPALFGEFMTSYDFHFFLCIGVATNIDNVVPIPHNQYNFIYLTEKGVVQVNGIYEPSSTDSGYLHVMNYTIIDMEDKITQIFKPAYK